MIKYFCTLMLAIFCNFAVASPYAPEKPLESVAADMPNVEKKIREAAVRVTVPFTGGHGSGSYIRYKDVDLIFTAQHVADGTMGTNYLVTYKSESRMATLIYADVANDIAILYLRTEFRTIEPMKYNPLDKVADVGTNIVYSGYPSTHKLMSFTGRVAGHEDGPGIGKQIILQTYGWFGCSGSMIYTLKGQQVGILYGVDVEYYPEIQVQENMIWVAPIKYLPMDRTLKEFCENEAHNYKACR